MAQATNTARDARFDVLSVELDGTVTRSAPNAHALELGQIARRCWRERREAQGKRDARTSAPRSLAPVISIHRARSRSRRSTPTRAASAAGATGDPDPEGDPDAVSPELGRFLDWLADEAIKEMVGR